MSGEWIVITVGCAIGAFALYEFWRSVRQYILLVRVMESVQRLERIVRRAEEGCLDCDVDFRKAVESCENAVHDYLVDQSLVDMLSIVRLIDDCKEVIRRGSYILN